MSYNHKHTKADEPETDELSFDDFDDLHYPRPEETEINTIIDTMISRRRFLAGGVAFGTAAFVTGAVPFGSGQASAADRFGFEAIATSTSDTVNLPKGYSWHILTRWGDPLWSKGVPFDHATRGTAQSQALAVGDNNDGMELYVSGGKTILAVNNEYTNLKVMYGNRENGRPASDDDVNKGKAAHGISVFEIAAQDGKWSVVKDSSFNRRITADTPMEITGPARGHDLMKTQADPAGIQSLGTWNNCGSGSTPWGTYLTCEENFNGYFSSSDESLEPDAKLKRYGVGVKDRGYGWARTDERFDIAKHPNEPNRAGYVVEIDPLDPTSTPKKRTALGRFKHENAAVVVAADGRVVVYMGDDERGEFVYRFVSNGKFVEGGDNTNLLETGSLYAAKFMDDQTGKWIELTPEATGLASAAEVCIYSRQAASAVRATTMDRPEWVAAHPQKAEVFCALTNNKNRGKKPNAGGDETPVGGPNPRKANRYGQIVRWKPDGGNHTADTFTWDLFVLAGNPTVHSDAYAGSENVTPDNMFNAPDGMAFDSKGMLWIQTDGKYTNKGDFEGMGNNQMLAGDTETGEIRRFLVGPQQAEVTGLTWSPDRKTMFVGLQHPGERGEGHFPEGGDAVPRSCIIAVTRDDGGEVG